MQPAAGHLPALCHIVDEEEWRHATAAGQLRPASLDTEGFVHCSFEAQLAGTLDRHFPDRDGLLILTLDPALVGVAVRVEDSYGSGEAFPHVYGPIPVSAVTAVTPVSDLTAR